MSEVRCLGVSSDAIMEIQCNVAHRSLRRIGSSGMILWTWEFGRAPAFRSIWKTSGTVSY